MPVLQVRLTDEQMNELRERAPEATAVSTYARDLLERVLEQMRAQDSDPDLRRRIRSAMRTTSNGVVPASELPKIAPRK